MITVSSLCIIRGMDRDHPLVGTVIGLLPLMLLLDTILGVWTVFAVSVIIGGGK